MTRSTEENQSTLCESEFLQQDFTLLQAKSQQLTPQLKVHRILPQRDLRMVGPWCFLDHFGPVAPSNYQAFDVAPHPHIGLQTITWLFSGELTHLDSLGYQQPLRAGQLNLMTAGNGISHAEIADEQVEHALHGLQLWAALPEHHEAIEPDFEHHRELPHFALDGVTAELIIGDYGKHKSPATCYHPTLALLLTTPKVQTVEIALEREFEYAIYVVEGSVHSHKQTVKPHQLVYLGANRKHIQLELAADSRVLILGGVPFAEPVVMWWNYVSHSGDRLRQADADWRAGHRRFGEIPRYHGARTLGPEIPAAVAW